MTPVPYTLKGYKVEGKFHGTLGYGANQVADSKDDNPNGFKSEKDLTEWARSTAQSHKTSISPKETYKVETSFVL